jgi:hypothetical protein
MFRCSCLSYLIITVLKRAQGFLKKYDNPANDNPMLKKAEELLKKYEDCEVKYYCNICPDFSTIDPGTLIEHHCSFHEIVESK